MRSSVLHHALLVLATTAALGCGGGGSGGSVGPTTPPTPVTPPPATNSVTVGTATFTPADLTVSRSSAVTWDWHSCTGGDGYGNGVTCVTHNIVFDDGAPGSGDMATGSFSRTFSAAGTYPYHCSIHGTAMSGRVLVQ